MQQQAHVQADRDVVRMHMQRLTATPKGTRSQPFPTHTRALRLRVQALAQAEAHAARMDLEQRLGAATREARGAREENAALREQLGNLLEEAAAGRAATDGVGLPFFFLV